MDRWESAIFDKRSNEYYAPISTFICKTIIWTACILVVTMVIMHFTSYDQATSIMTAAIIFGCAFLVTAWKTGKNIPSFATIGVRVGYISYILISFAIFITLSLAAVIVVMVVSALWVAWFFIRDKPSKGKKVKINYSDGSSEEGEITGKGITGETYIKGKNSGDTFID